MLLPCGGLLLLPSRTADGLLLWRTRRGRVPVLSLVAAGAEACRDSMRRRVRHVAPAVFLYWLPVPGASRLWLRRCGDPGTGPSSRP